MGGRAGGGQAAPAAENSLPKGTRSNRYPRHRGAAKGGRMSRDGVTCSCPVEIQPGPTLGSKHQLTPILLGWEGASHGHRGCGVKPGWTRSPTDRTWGRDGDRAGSTGCAEGRGGVRDVQQAHVRFPRRAKTGSRGEAGRVTSDQALGTDRQRRQRGLRRGMESGAMDDPDSGHLGTARGEETPRG